MKDSLTKPNMTMTVRFMAGLTKFQTSSENMDDLAVIVISLETTEKQRLIESPHWMFETQNPTFIQRLTGNKEQTFECSEISLNPFDLHVLGIKCVLLGRYRHVMFKYTYCSLVLNKPIYTVLNNKLVDIFLT